MENIEDWRKAGKIAAESLAYGKGLIKKGATVLEVSDKIDAKIVDLGAQPAFPSQLSCNHIAAHYCADPEDPTVLDNQLVCLDVGVHVNGAIGDNACTVDLSGEHADLVKASEDALNAALKIVGPGVSLGELGKAIEEAITSRGFVPIRNLSGHGLNLYEIHTAPNIPNYNNEDDTKLEKDTVIAIEPFATNGAGMIYETDRANIFAMVNPKPVRSPITRQVLKEIEKFKGLPFTTRWLAKKLPLFKVNFALKELAAAEIVQSFPPLPDKSKGLVSQAEHSVYIGEDKAEVLTKV